MPAQYTYLDSKLLVTFYLWYVRFWHKEGCNRGHGLSAAIKLGSLEKTVGASLIALWFALSSPFFYKKKASIFYGAKLIFRSFATFFGLTIF